MEQTMEQPMQKPMTTSPSQPMNSGMSGEPKKGGAMKWIIIIAIIILVGVGAYLWLRA